MKKQIKFSKEELVDFFYHSEPGKFRYDLCTTQSLMNFLDLNNRDLGDFRRVIFPKIMKLSKTEKFEVLCYILKEHVRPWVHGKNVLVLRISDPTRLCHRLCDDLGFEYKSAKNTTHETDSIKICTGSVFVDGKWFHLG